MKTMILSDLITLKRGIPQLMLSSIIIGSVLGLAMRNTVTMAACISSMLPFMFLLSIAAYDEMNGWERFRMSLPLSRRNVVLGRYASAAIVSAAAVVLGVGTGAAITAVAGLLPLSADWASSLSWENNPISAMVGASAAGTGIIMVTMSVALPLIMRYGMTKATRIIPIVFLLILCFGIGIFGGAIGAEGLEGIVYALLGEGNMAVFATVGIIAVVTIYALSAAIAVKLYAKREL